MDERHELTGIPPLPQESTGEFPPLERQMDETLAAALNRLSCSAGLEDGLTWFTDGNGDETPSIGDYRLTMNQHGIRVESEGDGFCVAGVKNGKQTWSRYTNNNWVDVN